MTPTDLNQLLREVRACRICEGSLEDGVRPVVQIHRDARVLIAGQNMHGKIGRLLKSGHGARGFGQRP